MQIGMTHNKRGIAMAWPDQPLNAVSAYPESIIRNAAYGKICISPECQNMTPNHVHMPPQIEGAPQYVLTIYERFGAMFNALAGMTNKPIKWDELDGDDMVFFANYLADYLKIGEHFGAFCQILVKTEKYSHLG